MGKTCIIAEAGVNHNGSIELAKKLIDVAVDAGADIVKFQTFKAENIASRKATKAEYQQSNMPGENDQFSMLKQLELSEADHHSLIEHCNKRGIEFWSTAFDTESIQLLLDLGIRKWKIPSGDITNYPLLQKIGSFGKEVIVSTGMCTIKEISEAMQVLTEAGTSKENITILHCNTEYPTPMEDVNLLAMLSIKKQFGVKVGYSDHTKGIAVATAAVALGAEVIEKHFTLDRTMEGPDHKASLEPCELKEMVAAIRNIEVALGDGEKKITNSEIKNVVVARKSIHIRNDMQAGDTITESSLVMKRPGDGISPMKIKEITGRQIKHNLSSDHKLSLEDLV